MNEANEEIKMNAIKNKLDYNAEIVNSALERYLNLHDSDYNILFESMKYSSLAEGKRIRAFLAVEFFSLFNKINNQHNKDDSPEVILPVACAIEMIHTYSLIHDDLPCMDDDDLRRGLPSNHKKFGEATALLAGDALLTFAFNVIANDEFLPDVKKVKIISEISRAAGHMGMIGGQMMDILYENKNIDIIRLIKTHMLKTGNMIMVSARAGCIAGEAGEEEIDKATEYAKNIGLAFQVIDDILDSTGDTAVLGKNTQSDLKKGKNTFVNILDGRQNEYSSYIEAFEYAKKLTGDALLKLEELKKINKDVETENLENLAKYLLERKK